MNVRPYPMYKEDVTANLANHGWVGPTAMQLVSKHIGIVEADFNNNVLPEDCAAHVNQAQMGKSQKMVSTKINFKNGPACIGYHEIITVVKY